MWMRGSSPMKVTATAWTSMFRCWMPMTGWQSATEVFCCKNLLVINVFSSPGSGKTSLLQKTAEMLRGRVRMGVIVGDLATDNDAERLSRADIPVVQITTGTMCHLDARMIAEAMKKMPLDDLDVLIIENVGNLVCPASYDLGKACAWCCFP